MVYRAYLSDWEGELSQIVAVKTLKGTAEKRGSLIAKSISLSKNLK